MEATTAAKLMTDERPGTIVADEVHEVVYTIVSVMAHKDHVLIESLTLSTDGHTYPCTWSYLPGDGALFVVSRPAPFSFVPAAPLF